MTNPELPQEYKTLFRTISEDDRLEIKLACKTAYMIARKFDPVYMSSAVSFEEAYKKLRVLKSKMENNKASALITRDIADVLLNLMTVTNQQEAEEVLRPVRAIKDYLTNGIKQDIQTELAECFHKLRDKRDKQYKK